MNTQIQTKQMNNLEEFLRTFLKPELRMLLISNGLGLKTIGTKVELIFHLCRLNTKLTTKEFLLKCLKPELRMLLKSKGLKTTGTKEELISYLLYK